MDLFIQDVIATGIALAAFVALAWRTISLIRPSAEDSGCATCAGCPTPRPVQEPEGVVTVVPLTGLRSRSKAG